jgi:hypothetical protein
MSESNLYAVPFTMILTDGTVLDGQVVTLGEDETTAKSQTESWLLSVRPWRTGANDMRQIQRSDLGEPEELKMFCGYGIGTKPLFWEMRIAEKKEVQSA